MTKEQSMPATDGLSFAPELLDKPEQQKK